MKLVTGDFDVWYKKCNKCGYDTAKSRLLPDPRCWLCGNIISRDYSSRALKEGIVDVGGHRIDKEHPLLILACSGDQAKYYARVLGLKNPQSYKYIHKPYQLDGLPSEWVFTKVGTWWLNHHSYEVIEVAKARSFYYVDVNKAIEEKLSQE